MNVYGIHTFEIMVSRLNKADYHLLKKRLKPISEYIKKEKYYLAHTKRDSGIRIRLYTNPHNPHYLRVIVNPWKLLNKVSTPMDNARLLLPGFDTKALKDLLCEQLRIYLGGEFGIDRFQVTRIDCTADIRLDTPDHCGVYINQIRNSIKRNTEREEKKHVDNDPELYKYCFRINQPEFYGFTVYDKLYDLIRQRKIADKRYSYGLLRFEISFEHRKINEVKKELGTDDIIGLTEYYTNHSEEFIKKFIMRKFQAGDFYGFPEVCGYLENNCRRKMQNKLITLLNDSEDMNRRELDDRMNRIFKTERKIRTVKQSLKELKVNLVVIPRRYNIGYLPGLYGIFGISRQ
ncbi:MAG: hypothetical protein NC120_11340 [Ruminococcus sp.]|nr:hypothetical protein [Ruminococcus sp.]